MTATLVSASTVGATLTDSQRRLFSGLVRERYNNLLSQTKAKRDWIARSIDGKLRTKGGIIEPDYLMDILHTEVEASWTAAEKKKAVELARNFVRERRKWPVNPYFSLPYDVGYANSALISHLDKMNMSIDFNIHEPLNKITQKSIEIKPWMPHHRSSCRAAEIAKEHMIALNDEIDAMHDESRSIREKLALQSLSSTDAQKFLDSIPTAI